MALVLLTSDVICLFVFRRIGLLLDFHPHSVLIRCSVAILRSIEVSQKRRKPALPPLLGFEVFECLPPAFVRVGDFVRFSLRSKGDRLLSHCGLVLVDSSGCVFE